MDSDKIIGLVLVLYVAAALIPGAFDNFFGVDTSAWDPGTAALFLLIPLLAVIFLIRRMSKNDAA
jgi:hypothetical protein